LNAKESIFKPVKDTNHYDWKLSAGHILKYSSNVFKQIRSVKKMIIHPEYNADNQQNDIAIILPSKPFTFTG
jgi:hypothetical protein